MRTFPHEARRHCDRLVSYAVQALVGNGEFKANTMTDRQRDVILRFAADLLFDESGARYNNDPAEALKRAGQYEIKDLQVERMDWGKTSVVIEVGRVGDEGTMASIMCRHRRHLFVGPRGGIELVSVYDGFRHSHRRVRGYNKALNASAY